MTKVAFLLISVLLSAPLFGQQNVGKDGKNMHACEGAINIFESGNYQLQFNGGSDNSFTSYPSLSVIDSENTLWCSYIAPEAGSIKMNAHVATGFVQMVIFEQDFDDICGEISMGVAEIKRLMLSKDNGNVGLRKEIDDSHLYSLHLDAGKKIYVLLATNAEEKKTLDLNWEFTPDAVTTQKEIIVDRRDDDFAPTLSFSIIDRDSKLPLVGALIIEGSREIQGMYTGSTFHFNITRNTDLVVSCDLEGYFFHDSVYEVSSSEDQTINIELDRVVSGKSIKIEDIQFVPGTSEIMVSSEPKLGRLKDFLALNSDLQVEIQGHVFSIGDNSIAGQKISEARAKRVMKYLIDNGIDRSRLTAVGYGNTRPVYPEPLRTYQEQANRRVEILIK